jgi:hypothetical protein
MSSKPRQQADTRVYEVTWYYPDTDTMTADTTGWDSAESLVNSLKTSGAVASARPLSLRARRSDARERIVPSTPQEYRRPDFSAALAAIAPKVEPCVFGGTAVCSRFPTCGHGEFVPAAA